ncbi:MAG: glutamine--fructose-6-phosphate transaminase (isomerizing), partial [Gammaproteobacteria bacterium]|nr:glutamine--fructose-6-phosphate transaminase (isomerizing) [Gammaproteobacteria bacterium]
MCGIVGAVAERNVIPILLEGLRRLEYRGYDSAGIASVSQNNVIGRVRAIGKVKELEPLLDETGLKGNLGIAHTRWATHGKPSEANAHPHICNNSVALVHNGIIENHEALREKQIKQGYAFTSDTDTETVVHEVYHQLVQEKDLLKAVQKTVLLLKGAYALAVVQHTDPDRLIVAKQGSPLVIGIGLGEYFIASDVAALLPVTNRFMYLEDGDVADITREKLTIYDGSGKVVERLTKTSSISADAAEKGPYRHYMLKEIYEQPQAISDTLEGRISSGKLIEQAFGLNAPEIFDTVEGVHILACGTSYHAGLVGKYWLEAIANVPCSVEIASEFRYRKPVVRKNSLVI